MPPEIYLMEALINLDKKDAKPFPDPLPTVLRRCPAEFQDYLSAIGSGMVVGLVCAAIAGIVSVKMSPVDIAATIPSLFRTRLSTRSKLSPPHLFSAPRSGVGLNLRNLATECRKGFLKMDIEQVQFWRSGGEFSEVWEKIFGAGLSRPRTGKETSVLLSLRCPRGFATENWDFRRYRIVEGPLVGSVRNRPAMCRPARRLCTILMNDLAWDLPVADMPDYVVPSFKQHNEYLLSW